MMALNGVPGIYAERERSMSTVVVLVIAGAAILILALVAVALLERSSRNPVDSGSWDRNRTDAPDETSETDEKQHWLLGESENVRGKKYLIGRRTATVGRKPANFIQLADTDVSRVHCRLDGSPGRCTIEDLESSHGTYVNGETLKPETPVPLRDGDEVRIGGTTFTYRRKASFETDDALRERKRADDQASRQTAGAGQLDVNTELLRAVRHADGGIEEVADEWGLEPEQIRDEIFGDLEEG